MNTTIKRTDIIYDLTIGIIVKNEEKYLEQCLKALLPLKEEINCEIIVTDTGSNDKTVEIAEQYADKVLNFEWSNDFSKARNTGVDASQGAWFMFVDADEIFGENVMEIAKFIKLKDRDTYNCATYIQRNYDSERGGSFNDFIAMRLFNLSQKKRMFVGKIHESIQFCEPIFNINCNVNHYGYVPEILSQKKERNKNLLLKELEENPNNIKTIKQLSTCVEFDYSVELAEKAFDLIDNGVENNYQYVESELFVFSMYCSLINRYVKLNKYDLAIKTCERYFNTELVKFYNDKAILPNMEIYFVYGIALFYKGEYQNSLDKFLKYQYLYENLPNKKNKDFDQLQVYLYNNELEYAKSCNHIVEIYSILGENDNTLKCLNDSQWYRYFSKDEVIINFYMVMFIKFDRFDLYEKTMNYYKENNMEQVCECFSSILAARIYFYSDLSYFAQNDKLASLNNTLAWVYQNATKIKDVFYTILSRDIEVDTIREMKIYIQIAYSYLMFESASLSNNDIDIGYRKKVEEIFVFYIESMVYYLNQVYKPVMFSRQNIDMLAKEEALCIILSTCFENRETNRVEYIKALKEALQFNEKFKFIILNSIDVIEYLQNEPEVVGTEFDVLAKKIKQMISVLIVKNELEQAKVLIEQYKGINPADPDIKKFEGQVI